MSILRVSDLTAADIPAVLEISQECGLCLWSADAYRSELARDDSIMLKLADNDSGLAGFAVGRVFDFGNGQRSVELTNIGLRETFRGQGFGQQLLKSFLDRCQSRRVRSVVLEVRMSNAAAISFYRKFGFDKTGRRRGFYSNPFEDALTMRLTLTADRAARF
jgi:ribosomal-protein-alanine N-acetyltransferase